MNHELYIQRCLHLAGTRQSYVAPNPMVGSIIVHRDRIIGEGYHRNYGGPHAEVHAINSVSDASLLPDSTLYVNLEPCSHHGKTPPCADLIIASKIPRVVIGSTDPNPQVAGRGIARLREAGIEVTTGVLQHEADELNCRFFTNQLKKRAYIILKWAQSADGFIDSNRAAHEPPTWITQPESKRMVHHWRSEEAAIMVGTNTALRDNPRLNVREMIGRSPVRVVLDRELRLPHSLHLFDGSQPTLVFTAKKAPKSTTCEFITLPFDQDLLPNVFTELNNRQLQSVMVEGGTQLLTSLLKQNLWDQARVFTGPQHFGAGVKGPKLPEGNPPLSVIAGDHLQVFRNR